MGKLANDPPRSNGDLSWEPTGPNNPTFVERIDVVHETLVSVLLDGGGLEELVYAVGKLLDAHAFVTTTGGRLLATTVPDDPTTAAQLSGLFVGAGRFPVEMLSTGTHQVGAVGIAVMPVMAGKVDHGRLVLVGRNSHAPAADLSVLERAAAVVALAITKAIAVQAVEEKYRGDFVRDVLQNRAGTPEAVVRHFRSLGWDVSKPLVVVVSVPDDPHNADSPAEHDRFANAWATVVERHDQRAPVVGFASEVVALIGVRDGEDAKHVTEALISAVRGDGDAGREPFGTGVSRVIQDPAGIPAAYEQARRALHVGRQLQGSSATAHFDDLGTFRLLSLIEDANELRKFVDEVLLELADERDPEAADLRQTLRVLLDTNLNVAETSRRLHFHYNTLRYRITKLERLLGPFTEDADLRLDLALALRVIQMRGL